MQILPLEIVIPVKLLKLSKTLNVKKASQKSDIPTKIVKLNADFLGNFICKNFNYCLKKVECPCVPKNPDFVLSNLSEIYKKLMYQ